MKRCHLLTVALVCLTTTLFGCRRAATGEAAYKDEIARPEEPLVRQLGTVGRHGGRFVLGTTVNPKTFNALMATETSSQDVLRRLNTALVKYDNQMQQFVPELAKSWEVAPDGVTWTFHLRKGAKFSDGHPITSEDVLFSFEVAYDPVVHPAVQDLLKVGGENFKVSAPDAHTVVINTLKPNAFLLDVLCHDGLLIMPKHVLEPAHKAGTFASAFNVGTPVDQVVTGGPFKLIQYVPGEKTVLGRNPYYYGFDQNNQRLPYLDEIVFLIVPDQDAADLKFRSGELDGLDNIKPENYKWYEENEAKGNFTLHDLGPEFSSRFVWFNLNKVQPPVNGDKPVAGRKAGEPFVDPVKYAWFSNVTFRRAVSMAIDRDAIIRSIFFGEGEKNWAQATRNNKEWYIPDLVNYDYNPEEAKRLLASIGFKDGNGDGVVEDTRGNPVSFTLKTNADNTMRVAAANFVKDDLAKVGIRAVLTPVDFNTLITNLRSDFQYESMLLGLQTGVPPSPATGQNLWRSSGETHVWFARQQKPATPEEARIDQLMDEILTNQDREAQKRAWRDMQTIVSEQSWLIHLPILKIKIPVSNRFGNVQPSIVPHRILWNADQLFVKRRDS
jgi:peptide/nickel transport system substrate-binding protein